MKNYPFTKIALSIFIICLSFTSVSAQEKKPTESTGHKSFWQASLPGGDYAVRLDAISSVSMHTYIIDAGIRVTEVVVDTNGSSLARFYYIIPVAADASEKMGSSLASRGKELLDQAGKKTGQNISSAVMKQYPATTHAKTVEYSISSEENLKRLYGSIKNAWLKSSGKKFTIKEEE